jgi:cytoskeletal protein RodZ
MALSQDEQRMLAEIERRLAADDPGLASCLTTFRRPGPATVLRSPRARIIGSLFAVLLVAMVSLMVYAMIPFRGHLARNTPPPTAAAASAHSSISATNTQPNGTQQSSAGTSTSAKAATSQRTAASQSAGSRSPAATANGGTQQAKKSTSEASP